MSNKLYIAQNLNDVNDIVSLCLEHQDLSDVQINKEDFAYWLLECIRSSNTEVLCSKTNNQFDGFMVLTESTYPWNTSVKFGTDLMFLCKRNGIKLVNLAKKIAKKRKWNELILSTTCNNERVDKFMEHISTKVGGVYSL